VCRCYQDRCVFDPIRDGVIVDRMEHRSRISNRDHNSAIIRVLHHDVARQQQSDLRLCTERLVGKDGVARAENDAAPKIGIQLPLQLGIDNVRRFFGDHVEPGQIGSLEAAAGVVSHH
jgi:hypothetical protein